MSMRLCFLTLLCLHSVAHGGSVWMPAGLPLAHSVESYHEQRYSTVYHQQLDFSCGASALASLLNFHYQHPVDEHGIMQMMITDENKQRVSTQGFSMLDMKHALAKLGFSADGFRLSLDRYREEFGVPAIALIETKGFRHFVVIQGVHAAEVLIGDPGRGRYRLAREVFESGWDGTLLVIRDHATQGRAAFNRRVDWQWPARAPFRLATEQRLMSIPPRPPLF